MLIKYIGCVCVVSCDLVQVVNANENFAFNSSGKN